MENKPGEYLAAHPHFIDGVTYEQNRIIGIIRLIHETFGDSNGFTTIQVDRLIDMIQHQTKQS